MHFCVGNTMQLWVGGRRHRVNWKWSRYSRRIAWIRTWVEFFLFSGRLYQKWVPMGIGAFYSLQGVYNFPLASRLPGDKQLVFQVLFEKCCHSHLGLQCINYSCDSSLIRLLSCLTYKEKNGRECPSTGIKPILYGSLNGTMGIYMPSRGLTLALLASPDKMYC